MVWVFRKSSGEWLRVTPDQIMQMDDYSPKSSGVLAEGVSSRWFDVEFDAFGDWAALVISGGEQPGGWRGSSLLEEGTVPDEMCLRTVLAEWSALLKAYNPQSSMNAIERNLPDTLRSSSISTQNLLKAITIEACRSRWIEESAMPTTHPLARSIRLASVHRDVLPAARIATMQCRNSMGVVTALDIPFVTGDVALTEGVLAPLDSIHSGTEGVIYWIPLSPKRALWMAGRDRRELRSIVGMSPAELSAAPPAVTNVFAAYFNMTVFTSSAELLVSSSPQAVFAAGIPQNLGWPSPVATGPFDPSDFFLIMFGQGVPSDAAVERASAIPRLSHWGEVRNPGYVLVPDSEDSRAMFMVAHRGEAIEGHVDGKSYSAVGDLGEPYRPSRDWLPFDEWASCGECWERVRCGRRRRKKMEQKYEGIRSRIDECWSAG